MIARGFLHTFFICILGLVHTWAEDTGDVIKRGDALQSKLATQQALDAYLEGEAAAPNNAELLYRIARQYAELMVDTDSKEKKIALGEKALTYAKRAEEAAPDNVHAQLALAVCYGRIAPFLDNKTKIAYSKLVKAHAEKAHALDPENDLAYHVLGCWQYELATLNPILRAVAKIVYGDVPSASLDEAVQDFQHAVKLNPQRLANHIELGRTLAAQGKTEEARTELKCGLAMPCREKDDPTTKQRGTDALKKL